MKNIILALAATVAVSAHATIVPLRSTMSVNIAGVVFIDEPRIPVAISEHCSVASDEVGAVMGYYEVKAYIVGKMYENKKLVSESVNMSITDSTHIWCVMHTGMKIETLIKELNQ